MQCLMLLSRPEACGRVALYFRPDKAVSHLYLGIPHVHLRLLKRMAADFGFSVQTESPDLDMLADGRLTSVSDLPWDHAFVAHMVNERLFVHIVGDGNSHGSYFPQGTGAVKMLLDGWRLPNPPPVGLTMRPAWDSNEVLDSLIVQNHDPHKWLLGRSAAGELIHVDGPINLYGRQDAAATWLVHQVSRMLAVDHANLVVIDGIGDVVPQLKRKTAVTRLLGEQLTYIDIDGSGLVTGLDLLAAVAGEPEAHTMARWQTWFQGMHVPMQTSPLLEAAWQDGVRDLPALQKWLKRRERQGVNTAVLSLKTALNRLLSDRDIRNWLTWSVNPFEILPQGALLFACQGTNWQRQQVLQAVLLAVQHIPNVRLVLHGLPNAPGGVGGIVSNGPLLANSAVVLTQSHFKSVPKLGKRFLGEDARLMENLALLRRGEGIFVQQNALFFTTWNGLDED